MRRPTHIRATASIAAIVASAAACMALAAPAQAYPQPQPVVSQVYGGGGNLGAQYRNDFIEVFNRKGAPLDLTGWSVQYAASTSATWTVTPLTGTLAIGQYLLVAEGNAGGTAGVLLPTADATGNIDMSLTSGKVALVSSFTPLSGTCPTGPQILDLVGYGSAANCFEGAGPTVNLSNTTAAVRKTAGCTDTNSNSADFVAPAPAPNPRNKATALNLCFPVPARPVLTATDPPSPSNNLSPKIIGSAPAATTVEIYTNATCSGVALTSGTAAQLASPGITVAAPANATTTYYALAFDANNTSSCSTTSVTYVTDTVAPGPPTPISSSPASPANDLTPEIRGSAPDGTTVRLYTNPACTAGPVATGSATAFASPGLTVTVAPDSTTTLFATATDAAGNTSTCSTSSVTYVQDSGLPVSPTFTASVPASPASNTTPNIKGSAEAGSTVRLYTDAGCTTLAGTGSAAQFASSGIAVTVAPNSTTTFRATATDGVGNTSACSVGTLTYVEDSAAPAAPTFASSSPVSPAADNSPLLLGAAEAGSTVRIYRDAACTTLNASGTAAQFASPGIGVTVPANSTTTFWATAADAVGNTSACSTSSLTYVEDSAPPAQPLLSATDPASPANDTTPLVIGSADAGSTVRLYSDASCSTLEATDTAAALASPGIGVTVPANSTTTFHATATDDVGNTSACSASSVTYVEDSAPPAAPLLSSTDPDSPASDTNPLVIGSSDAGSTVDLYTDAACTSFAATGPAAQLASPGIAVTVLANSTTTFWATATDAVGNTSACVGGGLTYVEDSSPPAEPTFTSSTPASPANDTTPLLIGGADAGSTVRLYTDAACSALAATGTTAQFAGPGIGVTVPANSTTTFRATASDAAGNTSACSASTLTYVEDSTSPAQPLLSATNPGSPAASTTPLVMGSAEAGSTVRLYTDAACSSLAASGTAADLASPGIGVTVASGSTITFHATATDAVGNSSGCSSSSVTYEQDSGAPSAPTLTASTPASPSSATDPRILGAAEAGSTVRLYTDASCSNLVATGSAAQLASPGIAVTVATGTTTFWATATDSIGNASACSTSSLTYVVPAVVDPVSLSGLRLAPSRFAISLTQTAVAAAKGRKAAQGTVIRFSLTAPARVSFTVRRNPPVVQPPAPTAGLIKTFGRVLGAGEQAVPFSGRLGQRIFLPGRYRVFVTAAGVDGGPAVTASAPFTILSR